METVGQRIATLRKAKGYSQAELADRIGKGQKLISDYERGRLRPHPDMMVKFAVALDVSADELLGIKKVKSTEAKPGKKYLRRMQEIEKLPITHQKTLLKTIDAFMKGVQK
jgi:transcriptional regulator with XRE-family HTH domain